MAGSGWVAGHCLWVLQQSSVGPSKVEPSHAVRQHRLIGVRVIVEKLVDKEWRRWQALVGLINGVCNMEDIRLYGWLKVVAGHCLWVLQQGLVGPSKVEPSHAVHQHQLIGVRVVVEKLMGKEWGWWQALVGCMN